MKTKAFKRVAALAIACCLMVAGFVMPVVADDQLGYSYGVGVSGPNGTTVIGVSNVLYAFSEDDNYTSVDTLQFTINNLGVSSNGISSLGYSYSDAFDGSVFAVSLDESALNPGGVATLTVTPKSGLRPSLTGTVLPATYQGVIKINGVEDALGTSNVELAVITVKFTVNPVAETGVQLSANELSMTVNQKKTLTATVLPGNATFTSVTWSSDKQNIAVVDPTTGEVTAVAPGKAIITATTVNGHEAECEVTVTADTVAVAGVSVDPTSARLRVGGPSVQLTANVTPENATDKSVTWTSSNPEFATVSATGEVTPVAEGRATITVTTTDGNKQAYASIVVDPASTYIGVKEIRINKTSLTYYVGDTDTLTVTITPENATNQDVHWSVQNANVTIDENGKLTAVSSGFAFVTATSDDDDTITHTVAVRVLTRGGGGSTDSSYTGGGGISGGGGGGTATTTVASAETYPAVTQEAANSAVDAAIAAAGESSSATVKMNNVGLVSQSVFQSLAAKAEATGITNLTFMADTLNAAGTAVEVRIAVNVAQVSGDLVMSASTTSTQAIRTKNTFETYFANKVAVISLGQKSSFGQAATVSAMVDLSGMDIENLVFYVYDSATNTYQQIETEYTIDGNGYVVFTTELGGDIVISDGVLVKK